MRISYIPRIDTFRAISVSLVIVDHYFKPALPQWAASSTPGVFGVYFFFVISGFLISLQLLTSQHDARKTLLSFYVRRTARIFPVYYLALAVGFFLAFPGFKEAAPWTFLFLTNFFFIAQGAFGLVGPYWSLAVEEQFYLLWPAIIFLFGARAVPLLFSIIVFASICFRFWLFGTAQYVQLMSIFSCMDALAIGALGAFAVHRYGARAASWSFACLLPLSIPAAIMFLYPFSPMPALDMLFISIRPSLASCFFAWLIVTAYRDGPEGNSWGGPILPWIGSISYGMYVYHLIVSWWLAFSLGFGATLSTGFIAVLLTIAFAWVSRQLLESPVIAIGKRLSNAIVQAKPEKASMASPASAMIWHLIRAKLVQLFSAPSITGRRRVLSGAKEF